MKRIENFFSRKFGVTEQQPKIISADEFVGPSLQSKPLKLHEIIKEEILKDPTGRGQNGSVIRKAIEKATPEDLAQQDDQGNTALHVILNCLASRSIPLHLRGAGPIRRTALEIIERMNPKDLNIQNSNGNTALHLACYHDYVLDHDEDSLVVI